MSKQGKHGILWIVGIVAVVLALVLLLGTVLTVGAASVIIGLTAKNETEPVLVGAVINVPMTSDGFAALRDGYCQQAETEGRRTVELTEFSFVDPYTTVDQTQSLDVMESVTAMIANDALDFVLYDDVAQPFFMSPEQFMDLREMFTEEELTAMGDRVIYMIAEDGERIPLAIDIRDTVFFADHVDSDKPTYLSFAVTTDRAEECRNFWQYIQGK